MIAGRRGSVAFGVGACLAVLSWGQVAAVDPPVVVEDPNRQVVTWSEWLETEAPAVVLLWTSWAPRADAALAEVDELSEWCRSAGLELVVVAVQEPFADAEAVLSRQSAPWLHDRHGELLKLYRVLQLPSLVIVEADGSVAARLEPSAAAVREWSQR